MIAGEGSSSIIWSLKFLNFLSLTMCLHIEGIYAVDQCGVQKAVCRLTKLPHVSSDVNVAQTYDANPKA